MLSSTLTLRLFLDPADSLLAAGHPLLEANECLPENFLWRWWQEPDEATVLQKIAAGEPLNSIDTSHISLHATGPLHYVDIHDLPASGDMILGAVLVASDPAVATEEFLPAGIRLYPNPFDHELVVEGLEEGDIVRVYDMLGKEIPVYTISSSRLRVAGSGHGAMLFVTVFRKGIPVYRGRVMRQGGE